MSRHTSILSFLFIALLLFSCSKDDEDPTPGNNGAEAVPFLRVGTEWEFSFESFLSEDTIVIAVEEQIGVDTFLVRTYASETTVIPTQYWVLKDNNLYTSFRLRDPDTYQIECKFNQPVGTSWQVKKGVNIYTYTIEAVGVTIETGKGPVNDAVKIKLSAFGSTSLYQYFSPTVGMLGNGSIDDATAQAKLMSYTISTTALANDKKIPAITFGTFRFLKTGNYWEYAYSSFFDSDDTLRLTIESKLPTGNIFKTKLLWQSSGETELAYWYEDNGMLMVYEEGETVEQADPIYMSESIAKAGRGWATLTSSGTNFIYTIEALNEPTTGFFGDLPCMAIKVTDGFLTNQTNYWHKDKGNVRVTGIIENEVISSNARQQSQPKGFFVALGF